MTHRRCGWEPLPSTARCRSLRFRRLLRDDSGLTQAFGDPAGAHRRARGGPAVTIAALSQLGGRRPLLVACPTGTDAGQLYDDLCQFMPAGRGDAVPGVGDAAVRAGQPQRRDDGPPAGGAVAPAHARARAPAVIVAGVRALLQRLGPGAINIEPVRVRPSDVLDPDALLTTLIGFGYRREELVEHRGEVASRGAIIDVFPSTADAPIRIDLWGDEVDRLTEFTVNDQRSTDDLAEVLIFPARELLPSDEVRARAAELVADEPWGREQWERLAEGTLFDGMESWLPWLTDGDQLITDVLPDFGQGRAGRTAADARPGRRPARRGGRPRPLTGQHLGPRRRPHVPAPACRHRSAASASHARCGRSARHPSQPRRARWCRPAGGVRSSATAKDWPMRLKEMLADKYRVVVAADGEGSAQRLAALLRDAGLDFTHRPRADTDLTKPGGYVVAAPLHRGFSLPVAKLAIVAEGDLTGRRRTHRQPRPRKRQSAGFFEDLKPGNYVVHHQHGVGQYEGMVKRTIGGVERDYLLLAYKGGDKLYVPSDQIDALRQYVGGETPSLHRLGGADFAKAKSRVRSAVREIAQELVVLYQKRVNAVGHAFGQRHAVADRDGGRVPVRRDTRSAKAIDDIKVDMERAVPDGPPAVRRRRLRQDRGRHPRRVQGDPGRQAGRRAGAHHAAGHAARQHVRRPLRRLPDPRRGAQSASSPTSRPSRCSTG